MRSRTDAVQMPVISAPLPDRVEKQRAQGHKNFDLEAANLSDVFRHKNKAKKKSAPPVATTETPNNENPQE